MMEDRKYLADSGDDRSTLESYLQIIWRRKWMIGMLLVLTTAVVVIGDFLITPIYEAAATLHLKDPIPSVLGGDLTGSGLSAISNKDEINTQIEILKGRSVLEEVIRQQGLMEKSGIPDGLRAEQRRQAALDGLRRDLSVSNIPNTSLIRVSVRSPDPVMAQQIANSISQVFIDRDVQSKRGEANAVLSFVSDQVQQVSDRLKTAEDELLKYRQEQGISVLDEETKLQVDQLADLEGSLQQVKVDRAVLGTRITALLGQFGQGTGTLAGTSIDPAVAVLQDQLTEAQQELTELQSGGSPSGGSPVQSAVADLKARIDSLGKQIQDEVKHNAQTSPMSSVDSTVQMQLAEYESKDVILGAQEKALTNLMAGHEQEINKLPAREINLARLERARSINEDLYAALMKAKNEAQIEAASKMGSIEIVDPAVTPPYPVRPNKRQNLVVGLVVSLFLGLTLAFLLDHLDHSVRSEEEVKKLLGVPVLGLIPRMETNGGGRGTKTPYRNRLLLVARDDPDSRHFEAFKLLRTNLHFLDLDRRIMTIVVTSAIPGDGKTTVAANLSLAFAAHAEKTLIVDADFRVPALHKIFNLPDSPGIIDALLDGKDFRPFLHRIEGVPNLDILTAGTVPPNASELVGSTRMRAFIQGLREAGYDRIVFDVAPLLVATETVDLASTQDGTLIVVTVGGVDRGVLKRMRDLFHNAKIVVLGSILNRVDVKDRRYGYSYYYYSGTSEKRHRDV